jgi:LPXTG-site transpeptidase (sortase) family protein
VGNVGDSVWTSLSGPNGTTGNGTGSDTPGVSGTTNGERNGTGTNPPNDYNATDTESFTADLITTFTKQITATSEAATTGTNVAIGEEITYVILLSFPEGTTMADTVVDDLPTGLEVVAGTAEVITTAAASGGLLADDFNGTIGTQPITETSGNGGSVQFDFTNVIVAGDNDTNNNTIMLRFRARVTDVAANQAGSVISNSATNQIGAAAPTSTNTVTATVVEPAITFGKSIISLPVPLDAGGVVHYRITYSNGTGATVSTAMDVNITDALAAELLLPSTGAPDLVITATGGVGAVTNNSTASNIDILVTSVPAGESVTVDFYPVIQGSVTPGQVIDNTGNSTWTSLAGTATGERDGSDGPAGSPDDYAATSSQNFTIDASAIVKQITLTSASHTSGNNVVIGEVITYDVVLAFAEGTTASDVVVDDLVPGLEVVSGSPQIITSAAASGGLLTQDFNGTIGTQAITEVTGNGGSVEFDFANVVVAADNNSANNSIVLRLEARVTNVIGNQDAVTLSNEVTNTVNAGTPVTSNSVTVTVVEPALTLVKTVSDPTPAVGQVLTFTLTLSHTAGTPDAFDIVLTDDIPAELDLDETSVAIAASGPPSSVVNASITSSTDPITVTADSMRLGGVITITYEATVIGPYGAAFNNTAEATWTSLFGVITGERTGAGGVDDYAVNAQANILADRALAKNLIATNVNSTTTPEVTIGEIVTYEIVLTIPAGSTDTAIVTDQLDSGLAFVSCSQMLASSASLTSTAVDFTNAANCNHGPSAVANNPVISPSGGATGGNTITFDLGDITNASASAETITLTYDVVVLDIAANVQNAGVLLDNDVDWTWATGTLSVTAAPTLEIVEPDMEIEKTVDPTLAALGSTVTFTIEIGHTPLSQTTAYDVIVTDNLPASLVLDELSVTAVTTGGVTGQTITTTPTSLIVSWDVFPLGGTGTITFQATFVGPSPAINSASVEWSSLEIDPILGVSVQQSVYNAFSTERRYDPLDLTGVNNYVVSSIARLGTPPRLPRTGFAPGRVTQLPEQPQDQAYTAMGELWLEIPKLGVSTDIVGVPFGKENWDLTWLADNAGYLDGTAYPTHHGNSGITAHAYLADGTPGPFVDLDELSYGDQIIVHIGGQQYIYEVREEKQVRPDAVSSVLKHEELPWLTLVTCKNYNETTDDYTYRVVVRAVLVDVLPE